MSDDWFVRVQDKEYGPVDLDTLLEWKGEGRLIAENEVRTREEVGWTLAGTIPALFPPPLAPPNPAIRRRTFGGIMAETFRIYRKGFLQFFALSLLVGIPSLGLKLSLAFVNTSESEPLAGTTRIAAVVAVIMLAAVFAAWPIFVAGLQFMAADLAVGRSVGLRDIFSRAKNLWPSTAKLSLFVYGSFLFWTALPLLAILTLAATPSVLTILLALVALAFQVYMAGRLFINFMFWQQWCTLGELEGVEALRDSRELARSGGERPRWERPLYRGAAIASLWILVLIAIGAAVELPFLLARLRGITDVEQAIAMMQTLVRAQTPDGMAIATYVLSSIVNAALRPLLGIAFVVLYFDARAGFRGSGDR